MITNVLIDSIWKEKTKPEQLKETIQSAFCEIYRGNFDEIKEVDEEQLYNSYLNSGMNTDRLLSDNNFSSLHKNLSGKKQSPRSFNMFTENDEEKPQLWESEIYEREKTSMKAKQYSNLPDLHQSSPVKYSTENVVDDELEEPKKHSKHFSINIHEPINKEQKYYDETKEELKELKPRISRRRSLTISPRNFKNNENDQNMSNEVEFNNEACKEESRGSNSKPNIDIHYKSGNLNNATKLKNITMNPSLKKRRLGIFNKKGHMSQRELNHQSFLQLKQQSFIHTNSSFKNETYSKLNKNVNNEYVIKNIFKNGQHEDKVISNKFHPRNRSSNSYKERPTINEAVNLKNVCRNTKLKRCAADKRRNILSKNDITNKYKS